MAHTPLRPLLVESCGPCRGLTAGCRCTRSLLATRRMPCHNDLPKLGPYGPEGTKARQRVRGLDTISLPNGVNATARPARRPATGWRLGERARASHHCHRQAPPRPCYPSGTRHQGHVGLHDPRPCGRHAAQPTAEHHMGLDASPSRHRPAWRAGMLTRASSGRVDRERLLLGGSVEGRWRCGPRR